MFCVGNFARIECRGSSLISSELSLDPRLNSREDRVETVNLLLHGTVGLRAPKALRKWLDVY